MAVQFKSLVSLLSDKRLKGKLGIYKTEKRKRLGLKLVVSQPETIAAEPSANVTLGRLLERSMSESKPEVLSYDQ